MTLGLGRAASSGSRSTSATRCGPMRSTRRSPQDRAAGRRPIAIVATVGTTSSTSVDPVARRRRHRRARGLWLHVDAAYAGAVALIPERAGRSPAGSAADSIVVNPHKWLFTPLDASLLLTRRMADLRAAFSLVPEYLRTLDRDAGARLQRVHPQLGRRFRALKLWIQLRWFGLEGLRRRIERHLEPGPGVRGLGRRRSRLGAPGARPVLDGVLPLAPRGATTEAELDARNAAIIDAVNRTGEVFLSHTRLDGRFTIRLAIGNLRTERRHVDRAWALLREAAAA